jgi:hypothetical protein
VRCYPRSIGRRLLLAALVGLTASTALAADSAVRTSFADGNWTGSGRLHQVIQGVALTGSATFAMKVRGGRVTGMVSTIGVARGKYEDVSDSPSSAAATRSRVERRHRSPEAPSEDPR